MENKPAQRDFRYLGTKNKVIIYWKNKQVMILKDRKAKRFLEKVFDKNENEIQLEMAKITGNFKRGNEKMDKKARKKQFKEEEKVINEILNDWDPIPLSPEDEYDCLTHQIISALHSGVGEIQLVNLIRDEIINHFGLEDDQEKFIEVSQKIFSYWKNKTNN